MKEKEIYFESVILTRLEVFVKSDIYVGKKEASG